jgi:hypothetical protein
MNKPLVVIAGSLAQKPHQGGHTWVFLQYLLGFRRLGYEVLLLDRLEPDMCVDQAGRASSLSGSVNLRYLQEVMRDFGLGERYHLSYDSGRESVGMERRGVLESVRGCACLLNFMGFFNDREILDAAPLRVFVDIDPGFGQMWQALGLHDTFAGHDRFVTIGENIGRADCAIPTCGLDWVTTKQPVVLDEWPAVPVDEHAGSFTSIGAWRGPYGPVEYGGRTYGLRVHEFRRFVELPRRSGRRFEVALDIDAAETGDLELLHETGWQLADPREVARDPAAYRKYVQHSKAEFMVAKNMYVQSRSGWFSDRSICYLASGRPVVAQDTGLAGLLPSGEGLLTYSTPDEAAAAVEEVCRDYPRHCSAACGIAQEYFDSDRVLARLLAKLGVG